MDQNQEILLELQKINQKIDNYTNPFKISWSNFLVGIFRSLGTLFGTVIVASVLVYIFSQFNLTASISKWIETTMSQVNWTKVVVPQTQIIQDQIINTN
ncbi:MAG: DUF5665 domain-containing protein [Candidatus Shapirobacteria bacterium]|nr:DUF5665 domain-containing protein [Candidatus Shapirobacteria bacterium]MDD3002933.1 DUF5665 domain-containing protein [Candidatus Shapirobacteria bacterium]MDD4383381.1 DUF5665 domain-containing protein [Candidatus Shapirobacteria bacterium]